jgi:di/tricarboxylate transporter
VIVLLAALIPVAGAMQATGAADLLARFLVETVAQGNAVARWRWCWSPRCSCRT